MPSSFHSRLDLLREVRVAARDLRSSPLATAERHASLEVMTLDVLESRSEVEDEVVVRPDEVVVRPDECAIVARSGQDKADHV